MRGGGIEIGMGKAVSGAMMDGFLAVRMAAHSCSA